MRYLFLLGSSRPNGNTEMLAQEAARHLPAAAECQYLRLLDLPLPPFVDIRHDKGVYQQPEGHEKTLFDATLWATDIVVASPLYWYNLSASTKLYFDYWSAWLRVPDAQFKARMAGKTLWGISASSSDEGEETIMSEPLVQSLRLSAEYMHMHWGGILLGRGNRAGEVLNDAGVLLAATRFFADGKAS